MYALTEKGFAKFFRQQPETGMGYWIATAVLKDGRQYNQVIVNSGYVTQVKNYRDIRSPRSTLTTSS
jgi:hypothetical protein